MKGNSKVKQTINSPPAITTSKKNFVYYLILTNVFRSASDQKIILHLDYQKKEEKSVKNVS